MKNLSDLGFFRKMPERALWVDAPAAEAMSLAKFFRADLIQHVTNWPSETFEKQVSELKPDASAPLRRPNN